MAPRNQTVKKKESKQQHRFFPLSSEGVVVPFSLSLSCRRVGSVQVLLEWVRVAVYFITILFAH